jgi:hypothetical protein
MAHTVIDTAYGDVSIQILGDDNGYTLQWSDGVANAHSEQYEMLSIAVGRLAVLIACGESEYTKTFTRDAIEHARVFESRIITELSNDAEYTVETVLVRHYDGGIENMRLLITDGYVDDTHPEWHTCAHVLTVEEWNAITAGDEIYSGVTFLSSSGEQN